MISYSTILRLFCKRTRLFHFPAVIYYLYLHRKHPPLRQYWTTSVRKSVWFACYRYFLFNPRTSYYGRFFYIMCLLIRKPIPPFSFSDLNISFVCFFFSSIFPFGQSICVICYDVKYFVAALELGFWSNFLSQSYRQTLVRVWKFLYSLSTYGSLTFVGPRLVQAGLCPWSRPVLCRHHKRVSTP